jgi:hypothetical protein
LEWNAVIAGESFHPALVLVRPLAQDLFGDGIDAVDVAEEMDDVFRTGQQRQISLNDDAIETVIYPNQQVAEQLAKGFHRFSFPDSRTDNQIIGQGTDGSQGGYAVKDFRELKVWQKAHRLTSAIYPLTAGFPREEVYGLTAPTPALLFLYRCQSRRRMRTKWRRRICPILFHCERIGE